MSDLPSDEIAPISDDDQLRVAIFDLRSPITIIRTYVEMLQDDPITAQTVLDGQRTMGEVFEAMLNSANRIEQTLFRMAMYANTQFEQRQKPDLSIPPQNDTD